jgi:hypothetical protein
VKVIRTEGHKVNDARWSWRGKLVFSWRNPTLRGQRSSILTIRAGLRKGRAH